MEKVAGSTTALVTGASGGIGQALAEQFAKDGINLVITARSKAIMERHAAQWRETHGISVHVLSSDLSQVGAADQLADQIDALGISLDYPGGETHGQNDLKLPC